MDDAQFPPETGDAKGTPARRARARLSDVEAVAATRLDMFGDNSLKETLAGAPPSSGARDVPSGAAQGVPVDEPPATIPVVYDARPPTAGPGATDTSAEPPFPLPSDLHPDPTGDAVPMRLGVSSIFDALDEAERATEGDADADAPPWSQTGTQSLDQSSMAAPDPAAGATTARMEVAPIFAALDEAERAAGAQAQADTGPSVEPDPPGPDQSLGAGPGPAAEPITARMEVSSIFAELIEAERRAGPKPNDEAADASDAMPPGSVEHNGWSILPSELIDRARREGDAVADDVAMDNAASGTEAAAASAPAEQEPEALPAPEPVQAPSDPWPPSDMSAGPPFPDPSGIMPSDELSHPPPFFRSELEPPAPQPPAPPMPDDAAAKIAAEANATAEALDNLQRLLDDNRPRVDAPPPAARLDRPRERVVSSPPLVGGFRMNVPPAPSPFIGGMTAPLLPLPLPPERSSSKGVYVLGFLAGLGLSLMAGAVLFLFISLG